MERRVLGILDFAVAVPTPRAFLARFLRAAEAGEPGVAGAGAGGAGGADAGPDGQIGRAHV